MVPVPVAWAVFEAGVAPSIHSKVHLYHWAGCSYRIHSNSRRVLMSMSRVVLLSCRKANSLRSDFDWSVLWVQTDWYYYSALTKPNWTWWLICSILYSQMGRKKKTKSITNKKTKNNWSVDMRLFLFLIARWIGSSKIKQEWTRDLKKCLYRKHTHRPTDRRDHWMVTYKEQTLAWFRIK